MITTARIPYSHILLSLALLIAGLAVGTVLMLSDASSAAAATPASSQAKADSSYAQAA